jgi:hypothetical protein
MLSSITPLGERGRGQRWSITIVAYLVGAVVGGALLGMVLGVVGEITTAAGLSDAARGGLALGAAVVAVAFDAPGSPLTLPRWRRQVNEDWLTRYRGWVYGFGFGAQLGFGLVTIVVSAVIYLAFVLGALAGSLTGGLVVGLTYGVVKGVTALGTATVRSPDDLVSFFRRLDGLRAVSTRLAFGADAALAAGLAAAALTASGMA